MIKILLVHDTCLVRQALAALLDQEKDMQVSTTAWTNAAGRLKSWRPQVCVADVDCPGSRSRLPDLPPVSGGAGGGRGCALLVLATASQPGLLRRASQARALGYVNKDEPYEALLRGIRRVARGERFVDTSLACDFLQAADVPLTERELSVLSLASEGASVSEIACSLHLSNGTVRNYMSAITRKTGARNRVDAIRISQVAGWV